MVGTRDHDNAIDRVVQRVAYLAIRWLLQQADLGSPGSERSRSGVYQLPPADHEDAGGTWAVAAAARRGAAVLRCPRHGIVAAWPFSHDGMSIATSGRVGVADRFGAPEFSLNV